MAAVITRLIRGGAQRIALECLAGLPRHRFESTLITGPQTGSEGNLFREARDRGVRIIPVRCLVREISPLRDWRALRELTALFRREQFHVVHGHTSKAGFLASLAARRARVPVVVYSPHGHIFGTNSGVEGVSGAGLLKRLLLLRLRRHAERCADRVIALNHLDLEEQVALRLAPRNKYRIIRNGIDLSRFHPAGAELRRKVRADLGSDETSFIVAVVGRLVEEKGHAVLFEAARILEQGQMRCELWLLGDGPLREELESRAARTFHGTRVRFLGMHPDIAGILPAADVLALPSRYESQGLVLIEAMASGVPVIATSVGGIPDLVRDGETGLLVDPESPVQLAGALERIAGDGNLHRRLVQGGLELARDQFDVNRMVREVIHLYEDLLDEWGGECFPGRGPPGEELRGKGALDFQGEW